MLVLLLYTGLNCTYSLYKAMRDCDHEQWARFAYPLDKAIALLAE